MFCTDVASISTVRMPETGFGYTEINESKGDSSSSSFEYEPPLHAPAITGFVLPPLLALIAIITHVVVAAWRSGG